MGKKRILLLLIIIVALTIMMISACSENAVEEAGETKNKEISTVTPPTSTTIPTDLPTATILPTDIPQQVELLFTKTFQLVPQIIYSKDKSLIFTHDGYTLRILDSNDYSERYSNKTNPSGDGKIISISPENDMVILQQDDKVVILYIDDPENPIELGSVEQLSGISFSANQRFVVFKSRSDCIQTLSLNTNRVSVCYEPYYNRPSEGGFFSEPAISSDGSMIAAGFTVGQDNMLYTWNTGTQNIINMVPFDYLEINCLSFSTDGKLIVTADSFGNLSVVDAIDRNIIKMHTGFDHDITHIEYSEDGNTLYLSLPINRIKEYNLLNAEINIHYEKTNDPYTETYLQNDAFYPESVSGIAFSPDGQDIAIVQGNIKIIRIQNQMIKRNIYENTTIPNANIFYSHNGKYLASISYLGNIHIWDLITPAWDQKVNYYYRFDNSPYYSYQTNEKWDRDIYFQLPISFSPDDTEIAYLDQRTIKVWNIADWTIKPKYEGYQPWEYLSDLHYSKDGSKIYVINDKNENVRISSGSNGDLIEWADLESDNKYPGVSAILSDTFFGRVIKKGSRAAIEIVDLESKQSYQITVPIEIESISRISFNPTGYFIFLVDSYGLVYIWQTATGTLLFSSDFPMATTKSAMSPDGQFFADFTQEEHSSTLRVWSLSKYIDSSIFSEAPIISGSE